VSEDIPTSGKLRIAWRLILLIAALFVCVPLYYLAAPFAHHNPVPRLFLSWALRAVGGELRVEGSLASRRAFLIANHVSWIDILALSAATGTAFVAHAGLAQSAPLRWLCRLNRTVFVARHERGAVSEQVDSVRAAIDDADEGGVASSACA